MSDENRPKIVIVGGGFGGLTAAKELAKHEVKVTLIDKNNYHVFVPMLYQVAAAEIDSHDIIYPLRDIFSTWDHVSFKLGAVNNIDLDGKVVKSDGKEYPYDYLIVAAGSTSNFFGISGAIEHSFPLKNMEQSIVLRNHVICNYEQADQTNDPEVRKKLLTFVIVGGGATGVEFAGALSELLRGPVRTDFPSIDYEKEVKIVLVDALKSSVPFMPDRLQNYTNEKLQEMGVELHFNKMVTEITPDKVSFKDGSSIDTKTVVWTAGVQGNIAASDWNLPVGRGGRIAVNEFLQLPDRPEVYIVGDLAAVTDFKTEKPIPMVATAAIQEGTHAARNIVKDANKYRKKPFVYNDKGQMVVIGRNRGIALIKGRQFNGFIASMLWMVVHIYFLIGFKNKLLVIISWAWDYISFQRLGRTIFPALKKEPEDGYNASCDCGKN